MCLMYKLINEDNNSADLIQGLWSSIIDVNTLEL